MAIQERNYLDQDSRPMLPLPNQQKYLVMAGAAALLSAVSSITFPVLIKVGVIAGGTAIAASFTVGGLLLLGGIIVMVIALRHFKAARYQELERVSEAQRVSKAQQEAQETRKEAQEKIKSDLPTQMLQLQTKLLQAENRRLAAEFTSEKNGHKITEILLVADILMQRAIAESDHVLTESEIFELTRALAIQARRQEVLDNELAIAREEERLSLARSQLADYLADPEGDPLLDSLRQEQTQLQTEPEAQAYIRNCVMISKNYPDKREELRELALSAIKFIRNPKKNLEEYIRQLFSGEASLEESDSEEEIPYETLRRISQLESDSE